MDWNPAVQRQASTDCAVPHAVLKVTGRSDMRSAAQSTAAAAEAAAAAVAVVMYT